MNTKWIMMSSSLFMGFLGIAASFLPHEIAVSLSLPTSQPLPLLIQILGGLYFAFAMLNWMAKGNAIGGIYSRPVSVANLTHFVVVTFALFKVVTTDTGLNYLWPLTIVYGLFSTLFAYIIFNSPVAKNQPD